jgi:hypothetical protein
LVNGQYQPLAPNSQGNLWSQQLGLFLGIEQGLLRFFTPEGVLVPTPEEAAAWERQRREVAEKRAERLAAKLRELNIDPDKIDFNPFDRPGKIEPSSAIIG